MSTPLESPAVPLPSPFTASGADVCLVYTRVNAQGRLGTRMFDLVFPPLGLGYIAAVLEQAGYTVRIVDGFAEGLTDDEVFDRIDNRDRIVGFYAHTANFPAIVNLARRLKASRRPPHVIVGGPHATAMTLDCLAGNDVIDAVAFGEGEMTALELVGCLLEGRPLAGVRGSAYRDQSGRPVKNPPRELVADLDTLPMPAWHLFPMDRYRDFIESGGRRVVHVISSRGCFSDCNYCHSTKMWGPTVRYHSIARVLREIEALRGRHGVRFIRFFDDIFTADAQRVKTLTGHFRRMKLRWCCSTRIDLLNEEIILDLKKGGNRFVAIGLETINDRLLKVINKHTTREETVRKLELCRKHGLKVMGLFILGLPTETREESLETIEFVRRWPFFFAVFSMFTPYPGTNFWHMLKDSPYIEKDFSKYAHSRNFNFIEGHRSAQELRELLRQAYLGFYLKPRVALTMATLILSRPGELIRAAWALLTVLATLLRGRVKSPEYSRA